MNTEKCILIEVTFRENLSRQEEIFQYSSINTTQGTWKHCKLFYQDSLSFFSPLGFGSTGLLLCWGQQIYYTWFWINHGTNSASKLSVGKGSFYFSLSYYSST